MRKSTFRGDLGGEEGFAHAQKCLFNILPVLRSFPSVFYGFKKIHKTLSFQEVLLRINTLYFCYCMISALKNLRTGWLWILVGLS
jgi:hypothetical protein